MNVDGGLDIVFNTRAELQGARQVEEQLQKQIGAAKALGQNYDELRPLSCEASACGFQLTRSQTRHFLHRLLELLSLAF